MAATLVSISGCSGRSDDWDDGVVADRDTRVCVNANGERIQDSQCNQRSGGYIAGGAAGWYYINRYSRLPYLGDSVNRRGISGSNVAAAGAVYDPAPARANMTRSAAISRGGFGSSSRSFGSGRS